MTTTIGGTTVALILANPGMKSSQLLEALHEVTSGGTDKTVAWYRVHVNKAQNGLPNKLTPECLALVAGTPHTPRLVQAQGLVKGPRPETYTLEEAQAILTQRAMSQATAQEAKRLALEE
jgi:hypothetical protein